MDDHTVNVPTHICKAQWCHHRLSVNWDYCTSHRGITVANLRPVSQADMDAMMGYQPHA